MRAFLKAALISEGLADEVTEATSGFEALRILPRQSFGLVCVDINMPDIHGFEVIRIMRASAPHKATPVIVISSEAAPRDRERGAQLGASAWLPKPFQPADLARVVRSVMPGT